MENKRIVVSGLGVISSIGLNRIDFWKNLKSGKSGISNISLQGLEELKLYYGGQVKNFNISDFFVGHRLTYLGRTAQFALAATKLALQDAGISYEDLKNFHIGVSIGTTMGEPQLLEEIDNMIISKGANHVNPGLIPVYPSNGISSSIARNLAALGDNFLTGNACSAGNYSFGHAYDNIKLGKADMMIAGGADSFSRMNLTGFGRLFAVAPKKCQPFDKKRKGMMIGEGAGIAVIETLESAQQRGAPIYAEILGYGLSCDAFSMTKPATEGIKKAINKALNLCNIQPDDVDYICAHGTGTEINDKNESQAIKDIFYTNSHRTPTSSIKSMLGHAMGAASALEGIVCCLAIKNSAIPPTINFENPDPNCDIDCVPNKAIDKDLNIVINNSFAFGGNNACLIFKKVE